MVFLGRFYTYLLHQSLHHGFGFQSSFLERNPAWWFWMFWRYHELIHICWEPMSCKPQKPANHGKSYHMSWDLAGFFLIGNDGRAEGKIQPKEKELFEVSSLSCTRFWSFTCISWKKPPLLEERIQMARGFNGFKFQPWVAPSLLCSSLTRPLLSASVPPANNTKMPPTPWTPSYVCRPCSMNIRNIETNYHSRV